jgi:hypothetical protein
MTPIDRSKAKPTGPIAVLPGAKPAGIVPSRKNVSPIGGK